MVNTWDLLGIIEVETPELGSEVFTLTNSLLLTVLLHILVITVITEVFTLTSLLLLILLLHILVITDLIASQGGSKNE